MYKYCIHLLLFEYLLVIGLPIKKMKIQNTRVIKFMESGIQMHINTFIWYLKFKIVNKKRIFHNEKYIK